MRFYIFKIVFFSLFNIGVLNAQTTNSSFYKEVAAASWATPALLSTEKQIKAKQVYNLMSELYESNQFNGSVLVIDKGEVIFHQAYGYANFERKDTMKTNIPVRLASVSKQFTAMAILILKEQNKLSLEDDITKFLPELPYQGITIRHLLSHCSGLPDYLNSLYNSILAYYPKDKLINNQDILAYYALKKPKLLFKPGKKASYCNTGFVLLALIIERISQMSFPEFMQQHIFEPIGMKNAFVYTSRNFERQISHDTLVVKQDTSIVRYNEIKISTTFKVETTIRNIEKKRAYGYDLSFPYPNGYYLLDYHQFDGIYGEKGICASTEDLVMWHQALSDNRLVSAQTLQEAFTPAEQTDRKDLRYGLGWKIYADEPTIVFHHGLYRGFRTYLQRNLKDNTAIAILSNVQIGGKMKPILEAINDILNQKTYKVPKPTKLEKNTLDNFKQMYRIAYGSN